MHVGKWAAGRGIEPGNSTANGFSKGFHSYAADDKDKDGGRNLEHLKVIKPESLCDSSSVVI